jgi:hypothetical protein
MEEKEEAGGNQNPLVFMYVKQGHQIQSLSDNDGGLKWGLTDRWKKLGKVTL